MFDLLFSPADPVSGRSCFLPVFFSTDMASLTFFCSITKKPTELVSCLQQIMQMHDAGIKNAPVEFFISLFFLAN